jgi:hypothetical protein
MKFAFIAKQGDLAAGVVVRGARCLAGRLTAGLAADLGPGIPSSDRLDLGCRSMHHRPRASGIDFHRRSVFDVFSTIHGPLRLYRCRL